MHNFVVHSNEIACRKSCRLGLEQVTYVYTVRRSIYNTTLLEHHHSPIRQYKKTPPGTPFMSLLHYRASMDSDIFIASFIEYN